MKGVYLYGTADVATVAAPSGVDRKVTAQIRALNDAGLTCRQLYGTECTAGRLWKAIWARLPLAGYRHGVLEHYREEFDGADFFYIRRVYFSFARLRTIREIRRRNPQAKILFEIPTYPFRKELTTRWFDYPLWWKEAVWMPQLRRYVDRIVTVSDDETIFGVPTIRMVNGIDLRTIRPIDPAPEDGAVHIAAVARVTRWHGYDRFLRGMADYYAQGGARRVVLHLVADGPLAGELAAAVDRYGVADHVLLHGYRTGAELDAIYDRCHLGLVSLATQDKDVHVHSTLKSREYLAKGLPTMATGMTDVFVGTDYPYNLRLPSGAQSVDIGAVLAFHDSIYGATPRREVIARIRAFAERTVDIGIAMAPVIRYLRGEEA